MQKKRSFNYLTHALFEFVKAQNLGKMRTESAGADRRQDTGDARACMNQTILPTYLLDVLIICTEPTVCNNPADIICDRYRPSI